MTTDSARPRLVSDLGRCGRQLISSSWKNNRHEGLPERKDEFAFSEKMDRNEWKNTVVSYIKVTNIEAGLNGLNRERMAREVNMESSGEFQEMNVDAGL